MYGSCWLFKPRLNWYETGWILAGVTLTSPFVQMISAEAPVLFAKAAQIFITELTLRAWIHTEDNKRRTLQVWLRISLSFSILKTTTQGHAFSPYKWKKNQATVTNPSDPPFCQLLCPTTK